MYRTMLTAPVFGLRREIDRLFEDTFSQGSNSVGWSPSVNIRETVNGFYFDMELAGLSPEHVELTCDHAVLTIRGERHEERKEGDDARYHLVERRYGEFTRSFQLPQGVNDDAIEAEFDNGLLRVRVPKAEIPQPRRINIQGANQGRREGPGEIRGNTASEKDRSVAKESPAAKSQNQRGELAGAGSR